MVCPTPATFPSASRITAPTGGFGVLSPRAPIDSLIARCIAAETGPVTGVAALVTVER
jgi:hypothetical protein